MVGEALGHGCVRKAYVSEAAKDEYEKILLHKIKDNDLEWVIPSLFQEMSDTSTPQGVMALVNMPEYRRETLVETKDASLICLEDIQDPGNLGTIFRTAEGAGMTAVVLSGGCVDFFNPNVVRSTMGSLFRVPFYITGDMAEEVALLRDCGFTMYAAGLDARREYTSCDYTGKVGILIGNEANGLKTRTSAMADQKISIPMEGEVESLNAAVSAALLMYEIHRDR